PLDILLAVFYFLFQWMVFEGLEAEWGAFKLTLYCALGWICALSLPLLAYALYGADWPASGGYWSLSVELAFAFLYPDFTIYVYLILPVKMKWMAWLIGAFLFFQVFTHGWPEILPIGVGLLNYLMFFAPEMVQRAIRGTRAQRGKQTFIAAQRQARESLAPRVCARCGAGNEGFLRLCCCPRCGADGKLWCDKHLPEHLKERDEPVKNQAEKVKKKPVSQKPPIGKAKLGTPERTRPRSKKRGETPNETG
ncbi:MAG: hypothetical protein ACREKE_00050, partial [bacterium]